MQPLAIDLFCGLGGWAQGLLAEVCVEGATHPICGDVAVVPDEDYARTRHRCGTARFQNLKTGDVFCRAEQRFESNAQRKGRML